MLEQLKYKNHLNEVFEFGKDGIFVDTSDLHDYEWKVTSKNNRISAFDYSVSKRTLPVIIICKTEEDGIAARNRLLEVTEKDIIAMQHGRIIIGDYYFRCFVTKSQKKDYLTNKRYIRMTLTLTSDFPYWVKETTSTFRSPLQIEGDGTIVALEETTWTTPKGEFPGVFKPNTPLTLVSGITYFVNWNGTEYPCLAIDRTHVDGSKIIALGKYAAFNGVGSEAPFSIIVSNGIVIEATDVNLSSAVTVSIKHVIGGNNLDMSHDIPYDFAGDMANKTLVNSGFTATNFRMVIYGACNNPAVYVSDHLYQVNCELGATDYLTIDSITKKIFVTAADGTVTNVFNLRNRDSYIFEMIPPGQNIVSWEGNYGVDITLIEERSEPKWT